MFTKGSEDRQSDRTGVVFTEKKVTPALQTPAMHLGQFGLSRFVQAILLVSGVNVLVTPQRTVVPDTNQPESRCLRRGSKPACKKDKSTGRMIADFFR